MANQFVCCLLKFLPFLLTFKRLTVINSDIFMATNPFKHFTVQNTAGIIIPDIFKGRKNMKNVCCWGLLNINDVIVRFEKHRNYKNHETHNCREIVSGLVCIFWFRFPCRCLRWCGIKLPNSGCFLARQNIFISDCKMYLSQIAKCICLRLQNEFVSKVSHAGVCADVV